MSELNTGLQGLPTTINRDVAIVTHPGYEEQMQKLRFGRENYEGSGGYAPYLDDITVADTQPDDQQAGTIVPDSSRRTHLFRHPREKKKFDRRVMSAYLTNVIKRSLGMIVGFLTKQQPLYDDYPDATKKWMSRVNTEDDNWEQFKEHAILPQLGYYGALPVMFIRMETEAITAEQEIAQGGQLQANIINPERIVDWLPAAGGGFVWLKVKTEVDTTGPLDKDRRVVTRYTWYTQDGWWYVHDDDKETELQVIKSGAWKDGLPLVLWTLRGGALTADANPVQRELYNVCSLIQEQERATAFAMLASPGDKATAARIKAAGPDVVWWFDPQARLGPYWMAPPDSVLLHLMSKRLVLIQEIMETMGLDFDQGGGQTGMAFQFRMAKIDSCSRGDTQSLARVAKELGDKLDDKTRVEWPAEFDAKDVEKLLDALSIVLDRVKSEAAKVDAQYRMALAAMPGLDEERRKTYLREIEASTTTDEVDTDNREDFPDREAEARERLAADEDGDADDIQPDGGAR
jgi:hypothetical protein